MKTGFVIGKFLPLHRGHMRLIDAALANCDHLTVFVCDKVGQPIPGEMRAEWIREVYPNIEVRSIPDTIDDDDSRGWANYTRELLGYVPEAVFTSEDYGTAFAKFLGAKHYLVDRARTGVHISATEIRKNISENWRYLSSPVKAHFAKRIVVLGAESTGTTTLAMALATAYETNWVPEYGREYAEEKMDRGENTWTSDEFAHIAREQLRREDESARTSNRVLVSDTDAFATMLWHERYMRLPSSSVDEIANMRLHDLYILTGDEIPFVQDGYRDGEHIRHAMHKRFEEELTRTGRPYLLVRGNIKERIRSAKRVVDKVLSLTHGKLLSQSEIEKLDICGCVNVARKI